MFSTSMTNTDNIKKNYHQGCGSGGIYPDQDSMKKNGYGSDLCEWNLIRNQPEKEKKKIGIRPSKIRIILNLCLIFFFVRHKLLQEKNRNIILEGKFKQEIYAELSQMFKLNKNAYIIDSSLNFATNKNSTFMKIVYSVTLIFYIGKIMNKQKACLFNK